MLLVALGNNAAREAASQAQPLFWGGLVVIYLPITYRLLSRSASDGERLALVLIMGMALYGVKILHSPANFDLHDELASWRQTSDLLRSGHFFSSNPLVAGYAGYPTINVVTAALVRFGHLSIFHAALVVIGVARFMLMLVLFLFIREITGSARAAGLGLAVYACNPSFMYFDSQYGYESLALPIAATLLVAALIWSDETYMERWASRSELLAALVILVCTLTISHHMTSYATVAFLFAWAAATWATRRWRSPSSSPTGRRIPINACPTGFDLLGIGPLTPALMLLVTIGIWFIFVASHVTVEELGGVFTGLVESISSLILGSSGPKTLFQSSGQDNPFAARVLAVASVIPLLALIPWGLYRAWLRPSRPVWRVLAIVAALFPITLGLRLTLAGTETSQRASEFVYVGLAFVAGLLLGGLHWPRQIQRKAAGRLALAAIITIVFLGGFVVGESPVTRQPGPFLVSAESRSVNAEGLAAAQFAARHLRPYTTILSDRPDATFLAPYAHLNPILGRLDEEPVTRVYFSKTFTHTDHELVADGHIGYIIVDGRQSKELPVVGIYFEKYEPRAFAHLVPISREDLTKFKLSDGLNRIYSNGPIVIYETFALPK